MAEAAVRTDAEAIGQLGADRAVGTVAVGFAHDIAVQRLVSAATPAESVVGTE